MKHIFVTPLQFLINIGLTIFLTLLTLFAFSQAITVNGTALTTASGAGSPSSCSGDYKLRGSGLNPSIVGNCVFLTDGTSTNGSGSISICAPLDLTNNFNLTFTANFGTNAGSGDGIAFTLNGNNDAMLTGVGGDMGYSAYNGSVSNIVTVEFDNWPDPDVDCHHAEINQNGNIELSAPIPLKPCCGSIIDGADYDICISWAVSSGTTGTLTATFNGNLVGSYTGDIAALIGTSTPNWVLSAGCGAGGGQIQTACDIVMDNQASTTPNCPTCTPASVTVSPNPESICSGDVTNVSVSGSGGTSFCWQAQDNLNVNGETSTLTSESSSSFTITETLTNGVPGNQTVTYSIYSESSSGCIGSTTLTVNVYDPGDPFCICTTPNLIINALPGICDGQFLDLFSAVDPSSDLSGNNLSYYTNLTDALNATNPISSIVNSAGTYYIRLEKGSDPTCFTVETFTLTVYPLPNVSAGPNQIVCVGDLVTLSGSGALSYTWDNGVVDGVAFSPSFGTTVYTVQGTDANSCKNTDQVNVTVNALPLVSAGADQTVCEGNSITLSGAGAVSYTWDNGVTDGVAFTPAIGSVTYTVTGTDANSCENTDQVVVVVNPTPTPNAGNDVAICFGESVTIGDNPIWNDEGDNYNWSNGASGVIDLTGGGQDNGQILVSPTTTTTYTVSIIDGNFCIGFDDVLVTVNALPSVSAGSDQTICDGSSVTLSGSGAVSYTWDNGVTDGVAFTPSVGTVTYTVTGTDANSCVNTDQVDVTVNALPSVSAGSDQTICDGSSVTLSGSGAVSYTWDNGVTDGVAFTPSVGTVTYTVTGTDANSCVNTDQVDVTVNPLANAGTNGALALCSTDPSTDLFNQLGGTPDAGGVWSPALSSGTGIFDPSIDAGGTYTYTATNSCGPSTADVVVTVTSNPDPGTNGALTLCSNGAATDLFNQLGGTPDAGGVWTPALSSGTGLFDPTLDAAGTYTYSLNACGGGTVTADVVVTVNALPSVSAGSDQTICDGSSVTLSGSGAVSYTWDNGVTDGVAFTPSVGTVTYTVTGTDANSCVNTDQVDVTVNALPSVSAGSDQTICDGSSVTLSGSGAVSLYMGQWSYRWSSIHSVSRNSHLYSNRYRCQFLCEYRSGRCNSKRLTIRISRIRSDDM